VIFSDALNLRQFMKYRVLILLAAMLGIAATGCKKSSHEIIFGDVVDHGTKDPALIKVKKVETTKGTDREGDYYTDKFLLENNNKLKFDRAEYLANIDVGIFSNIIFEETVEGPVVTISRRKKNASYELQTLWAIPNKTELYTLKYTFKATGE
jgi:hypothetical protein